MQHLTPSPATPSDRDATRRAIRWLSGKVRSQPWLLTRTVGLRLLYTLLVIPQAWLLATLLHRVVALGERPASATELGAYLLLTLVRGGLAVWAEGSGQDLAAGVKATIRDQMLAQLAGKGVPPDEEQVSGGWVSTLLGQVEALHSYYAHYLPQVFLAALFPLGVLLVVFPVNPVCGLLLLLTAPLIPLFMALIGMEAARASQQQAQALSRMSGYFVDRLRGLSTLLLFGRAAAEAKRVEGISRAFYGRVMEVLRIAFLSSAVLEFFSAVAIAAVAIYIGLTLLGYLQFGSGAEPLTLQTGLFILLLAPEYFQPLRNLATYYHDRGAAIGAAREIHRLFGSLASPAPESNPPAGPLLPPTAPVSLSWDALRFTYPGRPSEGYSVPPADIAAGEIVCLRGASGSGKSTLLQALLGLCQPASGTIRLNGQPLTELPEERVFEWFAWVGNAPCLFAGSIGDNLRLGNRQASEADLYEALCWVGADGWVRQLPEGLATRVGEEGAGLSGGEKQKIALARALLKKAPVLLLDEPLVHLDMVSAAIFIQTLARLAGHHTILYTSHEATYFSPGGRCLNLSFTHEAFLAGI